MKVEVVALWGGYEWRGGGSAAATREAGHIMIATPSSIVLSNSI